MMIKEIGEQGLLDIIKGYCPVGMIGDDGAVLSINGAEDLVVTTDLLVDEVHFSDRTTPPYYIGWKAAAANLSDLAAMGASPLGITVGLSLPGELSVGWITEFYSGLSDCLQQYSTVILGGDLTRSKVITVAITALGQVKPHRVIRRNGSRMGDAVIMTGYHGMSRAGLECLLGNCDPDPILIKAHQQPKPRLDLLELLWDLADQGVAIAGMDSSDGLADAIIQICRASGMGAIIEVERINIALALLSHPESLSWTLYGGEDFELVLSVPNNVASELVSKMGMGAAIIGKITTGSDVVLIHCDQSQEVLSLSKGYQHF